MASAGLKRSSTADVPPHSQTNQLASTCWSANKRRCTSQLMASHQQQHQLRPFRDPASILGSLSDDVTAMIKNEVNKHHHQNQHHHQQQLPHHSQHLSHQLQQQQQHNLQHEQLQHPHLQQNLTLHHNQQQQQQNNPAHHHQQQHQNQPHLNQNSPNAAVASSQHHSLDAPVLSIRQTQAICEKLIKEREQKLREEYDKILISKLAEQYDTFVKYTHDHIERRYNETNSHQASYLS